MLVAFLAVIVATFYLIEKVSPRLINEGNPSPLWYAVYSECDPIHIEQLINHGTVLDYVYKQPLHLKRQKESGLTRDRFAHRMQPQAPMLGTMSDQSEFVSVSSLTPLGITIVRQEKKIATNAIIGSLEKTVGVIFHESTTFL